MKREEINTYLYNQYISTGNVNFLHQIIHDYDKFIYKTILETLIENKISSVNPEECYSYVYYDIFKHLEKMSVNNVSPHRIGLSIKRWILSSMVRFIEEEKLLDDKIVYVRDFYEIYPCYKEEIEDSIMNEERKKYISLYMKQLTPREKEAIDLLYGFNNDGGFMSHSQVAAKMDVSVDRVRQLENSAFKWIVHQISRGAIEDHPIMIEKDTIRKHFCGLDYYEQRIVSLYYGLNSKGIIQDTPQIAKTMKMSELRVDYIRRHALAKLYHYAREDYYKNKRSNCKRK